MFEKVKDLEKGIYVFHPKSFNQFELMDFMVPSFVVAVGDGYLVVFDPRSSTVGGFLEQVEIREDVKRVFEDFLDLKLAVSSKDFEGDDPIRSLEEDVEFYQELGVKVVEKNGEVLMNQREIKKLAERFRIYNLISEATRDFRYSLENPMISVSPGMAGLSFFTTLDTRFMLWIRNETGLEGEKFRYSLIRAFNVVIAKLARRFKYEKMNILPYEVMIIPTRNEEKLRGFFDTVKLVNANIGQFLSDKLPEWVSSMTSVERSDVLEVIKSREEFLDSIAAIPDRRGVNLFKNKIVSLIETFSAQLDTISKGVGEWLEAILKDI